MVCNVRTDFHLSSCTGSQVHVTTHKLHCDVIRPTVLCLGRNVDEMEMLGLTFNTEFHENSSLFSNLNIL
jgi:hypothetical protein